MMEGKTLNAKPYLFAIVAICVILLAGCLTPNLRGPCCTKTNAYNGMCEAYTPGGADTPSVTYYCNGTTTSCTPTQVENCTLTGNVWCRACVPGMSSNWCSSYCTNDTSSNCQYYGNCAETCDSNVCYVERDCFTNYCVFAESSDEENETVYVKYTNDGSGVLNETLDCTNMSDYNVSDPDEPCNNIGYCRIIKEGEYSSYPICTERSEIAYDTECKTMICGNIKYSPKMSFLPDPNHNITYQNLGGSFTMNLYNAMCNFYVLDNQTMRKLKKAKNVFVNTMRIGVGSSISDFEEARLYLPLSDRFCGITISTSTAADRYVNYLNLSIYDASYDYLDRAIDSYGNPYVESRIIYSYRKFDPSKLTNSSISVGCTDFSSDAKFGPAIGGSYLFRNFTEGRIRYLQDTEFVEYYLAPDFNQYEFALYGAYWDQIYPGIRSKTITVDGVESTYNTQLADFECDSSGDCLSGLCQKEDFAHERGMCLDPSGNAVNCLCYEVGSRGSDGNEMRCEPFADSSSFAPLKTNILEPQYSCTQETCTETCDEYDCTTTCTWGYGVPSSSCTTWGAGCSESVGGICNYGYDADAGQYWYLCENTTLGASADNEGCLYNSGDPCTLSISGKCKPSTSKVYGTKTASLGAIVFLPSENSEHNSSQYYKYAQKYGYSGNFKGFALMNTSEFSKSMLASKCGATAASIPRVVPYTLNDTLDYEGCSEINTLQYCCNSQYSWGSWTETCNTYSSGADCDYVKYEYYCNKATDLIAITGFDTSKCQYDDGETTGIEEPNFPKLNSTFGWCESCTFNTLVGIDLDSVYNDFSSYTFSLCNGSVDGAQFAPLVNISGNCGLSIKEYISNVENIRNRVDNYLRAGAMPVIWYTSGELGYTNAYSNGQYLVIGDRECDSVSPSGSESASKVEKILTSSSFYYSPDSGGFFESADASCYVDDTHGKVCDTAMDCQAFEAKGAEEAEGESVLGAVPKANGEKADLYGWTCKDDWFHPKWLYCSWTASYYFLKRTIGNSASMVVVATDDMDISEAGQRARYLKKYNCPRCLTAIYSSAADESKLSSIFGCSSGELSCKGVGSDAWKYIDVILFDQRANFQSSATDEEIIDDITNKSRKLLQKYGKPSMPYNFNIRSTTSGEWNKFDRTYSAMRALLTNQSDLIRSGLFGIFYSEWAANDNLALVSTDGVNRIPTVKGEKFCAFERAIDEFLYPKTIKSVFSMIQTVNASDKNAECIECSDIEIELGKCTTVCENGMECAMPEDADLSTSYKCPMFTAIEPCNPCNSGQATGSGGGSVTTSSLAIRVLYGANTVFELNNGAGWSVVGSAGAGADGTFCLTASGTSCGGTVCTTSPTASITCPSPKLLKYNYSYSSGKMALCNITYENGTTIWKFFPFSSLSDSYADVIGSLPKTDKCCLESEKDENNATYNYTYMVTMGEGYTSTPIRFPRTGDITNDCGLGTDESTSFCGVDINIKDYKIECSVYGE